MLDAAIRHQVGRLSIDVALRLDGGFTALLGPSGAGKTTLLHIIAGLIRPDHAVIAFDGDVVADTTRGVWQPAHARRFGSVFQESRLFPHLTVHRNLTYARWAGRRPATGLTFEDVVTLLGLEPLLDRSTARLSGGEMRRVALGRTLLSQPRLLLLDEPLGSVDEGRRQEILPYLDRVMAEHRLPIVYVTHDRSEIAGRARTVIRLANGRVE